MNLARAIRDGAGAPAPAILAGAAWAFFLLSGPLALILGRVSDVDGLSVALPVLALQLLGGYAIAGRLNRR